MNLLQTTSLSENQKLQLFQLWNAEYPVNLSYASINDFENYLSKLEKPKHFLFESETNEIKAWAFTFDRENERRFAIILSQDMQGKGIGKQLMEIIQTQENALSGWVVDHNNYTKTNGEVYVSPLGFYEKCGFTLISHSRLEMDMISAVKIFWKK